ncbi:FabD/lysophospholipase-like protein [Apiospora marii]|uniref:FabD/lysophospholipase-like protein n=1 Tax=Apiospora marii TaxID=335849 RepID=A0ABR1R5J8_9PEZI
MEQIRDIETRHPEGAHHTSADYPWGEHSLNSGSMQADEGNFWPCHYFDYIAGTSTGGLSAIMLGRLRMTVGQAISAYKTFGDTIFGKPRSWHINSALWFPRSKYPSSPMETVIAKLISQQLGNEDSKKVSNEPFESPEGQTRTIVFSCLQTEREPTPYLWRSYNHESRTGGQDKALRLNLGLAARAPIWQVARATSAAPRYFEPILIDGDTHVDGAVGVNNPSPQTIDEVYYKENKRVPALSVSIGTGVNPPDQENRAFPETIRKVLRARKTGKLRRRQIITKYWELASGVAKKISDTETAVKTWERDCTLFQGAGRSSEENFEKWWYRLNVDGALKAIPLDDWTPRKGGQKTLGQITDLTEAYLRRPDVEQTVRRIAEALVKKRRERVQTERWEHFIMKVAYRCPLNKKHEELFDSRDDIRKHLVSQHQCAPEDDALMHQILSRARVVPNQSVSTSS